MISLIVAIALSTAPATMTTSDMVLWADPTNGIVNSSCLNSARPCKDPQFAVNNIPKTIRHNVDVNIAAGDVYLNPNAALQTGFYGGSFTWTDAALYLSGFKFDYGILPSLTNVNTTAPRLKINCSQTQVLGVTTPTSHTGSPRSASTGGGPSEVITKTAAGWTVHDFKGDFIKFTADSKSFPIVDNDATTITFTGSAFDAGHAGTFTIWKPGTVFHPIYNNTETFSDVDWGISIKDSPGSLSKVAVEGNLIEINYCEVDMPSTGGFGAFGVTNAGVVFNSVKFKGTGADLYVQGRSSVTVGSSYFSTGSATAVAIDESSIVDLSSIVVQDDFVSNFEGFYVLNGSHINVASMDIISPRIVLNASAKSVVSMQNIVAKGNNSSPQTANGVYSGAHVTYTSTNFTDFSSIATIQYGPHFLYEKASTTNTNVTNQCSVDGTVYTRVALEALTLSSVIDNLGSVCGGI